MLEIQKAIKLCPGTTIYILGVYSFQDGKAQCWFGNWSPYTEGKKRPRKETDHSRLVNGGFNKQENLCTRLILGSHKRSRSPQAPARILKVCIELLTKFSHVSSPDGLNSTLLSQGCVLENSSCCGNRRQNVHSKDKGEGEEPPIARVQITGQLVVTPSQ